MAQKKSKTKQKTADKDGKTERTPPAPAPGPALVPPAESQPEEQPIPVPEPLPLPVPPPVAKKFHDHATRSISHEDDHPVDKQEESPEGWGAGDGGDWQGVDESKEWGNDMGWTDDVDRESEGQHDLKEYGDHGNLGWGQTDTTPAHSIDQEQSSLGQPVQNHVPTQATPASAPSLANPPLSAPPLSSSAVSVKPAQSSESAGHTNTATPQNKSQNPPHFEPKNYIFASSMANRNRPTSQPASSVPASSRPSYYWAPNQRFPQKQSMPTTKSQHNTPLSNLTPWGQPKPWGDPKPQPILHPPAPAPAPLAATQKRPAWYDWGKQPQTAASAPLADRSTGYSYDYDSDDDEYTDNGYDEDDGTHDVWGQPSNANNGWASDPRKGYSGYQQQPQKHHPLEPRHYPEPSHHQLEKARRLKQIAEEQRRLAMEMEIHQQQKTYKQHHEGAGKSSKKHKHKGDGRHDDNGWGTKDEWGASSGWVNDGGRGQDNDSWGQSGNNGWDQSGNSWEKDGGNSWGHGGDDRDNSSGDGWNNGEDTWGNNGGNGWNNTGGDGWNSTGGNGWNSTGGDGWNNNGGDGWNNDGGGSWGNSDGNGWGKGNGGQVKGNTKDKNKGDTWAGHDNSWGNTQGLNDWGASDWDKNDGWGDGNDKQALHEAGEDWREAISVENPKATNSSISLRLGLPQGTINESGRQAFEPALKAIFGNERLARDRIHWMYAPDNEAQVTSILYWIHEMESFLAFLGLLKFLETKERGALFVNVTHRLMEHPDKPVFDWLGYKQVQKSRDRILQHSILAIDPAEQTVIFVYLLSRTGNSVAMWRRKLQVPKDVQQKHLRALKKVKAGLRPDKDLIYVDELPPSDKRKEAKPTKSAAKVKQAAEPAKPIKSALKLKQATKAEPAKLTKSALKTHQRGQSLPTKKSRKWWQILRFAD